MPAIALLASFGIADAKKGKQPVKLSTVRVSETAPTGTVARIDADCKPGHRLVSAGFDTRFPTDGQFTFASELIPGKRSAELASEVSPIGGSEPDGTATLLASCMKKLKTKVIEGDAVDIEEDQIIAATASCSGHYRAISGGFQAPNSQALEGGVISTYRASKRTWRIEVYSGNGLGVATPYVVCVKGAKLKRTTTTMTPVEVLAPVDRRLRCPRGTRVVSGGFDSSAPTGPATPNLPLAAGSFKRGKKAWMVRSMPAGPANATAQKAFAYCAKKL